MIDAPALEPLLASYLSGQRWFAGGSDEAAAATVASLEEWSTDPVLWWALVDSPVGTYQLLLGAREPEAAAEVLRGKEGVTVGAVHHDGGDVIVYDALVDSELVLRLAGLVVPEETWSHSRAMAVEQSNSSLVIDERCIFKVFRRPQPGPNPDVELPEALSAAGFEHVPASLGVLRRGGMDLLVAREFLGDATEGWQLALTSLRDLFAAGGDPAERGGDFAPEAGRLGEVTAQMHLALARLFGIAEMDPGEWADDLMAKLGDEPELAGARPRYEALRRVKSPGMAIRVHGDYHLGQTMRATTGWYVLDFEGEPAVPLEERRLPRSPLRDVAGMLRSFHYAAEVARREQGEHGDLEAQKELAALWRSRVTDAFVDAYLGNEGIAELLPGADDFEVVLAAALAGKAVYEVAYERAYRPSWVDIPLTVLR